ncbi:LysR family transcriptional regulator [Paraferrimonas sedimenticola]|uniref:LysR family transcriptional regulator n=1 Tax=Paraferrimonas sedimenticola TaxID=375674 RepID=A0AA37RW47_9GAMM|nr:LysR family transcriptional regulator [Paraferrimonas sedimenticola]GLP95857.1 LysR family transcriptional regulator [Paraferrimonas sedimenticola]
MNYSIELIKAFVETVKAGSFRQAALKMGKHPTTVGQQVSNLEIDTGLELFDRSHKKFTLTTHGELLYQRALPIIDGYRSFSEQIDSFHQGLPARVSVAIDANLCGIGLTSTCAKVIKKYPNVDLAVFSGDSTQIFNLVRSGEADIGVVIAYPKRERDIQYSHVQNFEVCCIAPVSWPNEKLTHQSYLKLPQVGYMYMQTSEAAMNHTISDQFHMVQSVHDAIELVESEMAWAIIPAHFAELPVAQGRVKRFENDDMVDDSQWWIEAIRPVGSQDTVVHREILDALYSRRK